MNIFSPKNSQVDPAFQALLEATNQSRVKFDFVHNLNEILDEPYKICLLEYLTCDPDKLIRESLIEYQNLDFGIFDLVIIVDIFCWDNNKLIQSFVQQKGIKNYLLLTPDSNSTVDEAMFYPHYLFQVLDRNEFKESNHYIEKPFLFDALLGSPRAHRSYVMKRFQENADLLSQSVVTYKDVFRTANINAIEFKQACAELSWLRQQHTLDAISTDEIWYPYVSAGYQLIEKYDILLQPDEEHTFFMIPWKIYANTWYSILTETNNGNRNGVSLTEKIGKAFFAKRIFILFGAAGSLTLLKKLGFRTFDSVIDETYDTVQDHMLRWEMAFDQVKKLAKLDPRKIYDQTEEIREHNFNRLREYYLETQNKVQRRVWLHIAYGQHAIRMMHALNNDA